MINQMGVLCGLKIIDFSWVFGGFYCFQVLVDYGVEVIKLEFFGGDEICGWGLFFEGDMVFYFKGVNCNKKGIVVDLVMVEGIELLLCLLEDVDVLLENFKFGILVCWGIGYEEVFCQCFLWLVYCVVLGFGVDGLFGGLFGYDVVIQVMVGLMSVNGEVGGEVLCIGLLIVDMVIGLNVMVGIFFVFYECQVSGCGQLVDIVLYDCGIFLLYLYLLNYFVFGCMFWCSGNVYLNIVFYDSYCIGIELIFFVVGNDCQFVCLCEYLGVDELLGDLCFVDNGKCLVNCEVLKCVLEDYLVVYDGCELVEWLICFGVFCGVIVMVEWVVEYLYICYCGMVVEFEGYCGIVLLVKFLCILVSYCVVLLVLGGDIWEVLVELGLSVEVIDVLVWCGIVCV